MSLISRNKPTFSKSEVRRQHLGQSAKAGLHFDGAAGNIDIASPPDLGTKFSFEFVLKADSWDSYQTIFDFGTGGRFQLYTTNGTSLKIYQTSAHDFTNVSVLGDLKVHHLVLTVDGTSAVLYDNGNQVATTSIESPNIDSCSDARIGSNYAGLGGFFDGTIYRCRFWNKALSSAEVQTAYERADVDFIDQYGEQDLVDAAASVFTIGSGASTYNWVAYTGNSIANVSSDLTITYGGNSNGAYNYLRDSSDLNQNLVVGKKYRLRIRAKYAGGAAGVAVQVYDGSASTVADSALTTSFADYEIEFTAQSTTGGFVYLSGLKSSNVVTIDTWQVDEIGCVSDYDLAFASPTQSRMVQDRSGAADGTASTSGVTQVQKVVQLNATAARIGTSAATPADGEIIADKIIVANMPTSASGLASGTLYSDSGTIKIV